MQWEFGDRLKLTQRQAVNPDDEAGNERAGERTFYVYDAGGQRVRKVTELASGAVKDERVYVGTWEIYRRRSGTPLVRETLRVSDDKQRVALVETRTAGVEPGVPSQLIRYQLGNHLGSASLELDADSKIVSYEEYTPYGSTSFQAVRSRPSQASATASSVRSGMRKAGFYYYGSRYYAVARAVR
jgi:hypothetical protein